MLDLTIPIIPLSPRRAALGVVARASVPPPRRVLQPATPGRAAAGATQRIVASIITAITERRLMPGTKLAEQKIADIFKVSRTIVRQALNQLSRDRLVTLEPARGAFVAMPSVEEARQVYAVRAMMETAMVRQLAPRITAAQLTALRVCVDDEQEACARAGVSGGTRLRGDFHTVLSRMLGNDVLAELLADLLSRSSLISIMYPASYLAERAHDEHVRIVDALEKRDAGTAARLMKIHIEGIERGLSLEGHTPDLSTALRPRG